MTYTKQKHKAEPTGFKITNLTYINNIYPKIDDKKIKSRAATLILQVIWPGKRRITYQMLHTTSDHKVEQN